MGTLANVGMIGRIVRIIEKHGVVTTAASKGTYPAIVQQFEESTGISRTRASRVKIRHVPKRSKS